jgi:hypothetical protein
VFNKLILAFARRPASAAASAVSAANPVTASSAVTGDPPTQDPSLPDLTLTLVERQRLHVMPLNSLGGRVPCGPFSWKWEEPLGKLDISADTTAAWFYPAAVGICAVTVAGANRQAVIRINIIPAVPETLNLQADPPEVFRELASVDTGGLPVL